jgi:hypothetical protein
MKLSAQLLCLTTAFSLTACSSYKNQPATQMIGEFRQPASMIWEEGTPSEEMPETTVKWYEKSIAQHLKTTGDAHAKIADLIAQAKVRGGTCSGDFYFSDLITHYLTAISVNNKITFGSDVKKILSQTLTYRVAEKMRKDPDALFNEYGLLDYYRSRALTAEEMDGVYFESMGQGVYGSTFNLTFNKDGTFKYSRLVLDDEDDSDFKWVHGKGTWSTKVYEDVIRGRKAPKTLDHNTKWEHRGVVFFLDFDGNNKVPSAYRLRFDNGVFRLETRKQDLSTEEFKKAEFYSSVTSECDA